MTEYSRVSLFYDFTIDGKTYYEDSLHKPRFPSPADAYATPPDIGDAARNYYNVAPRKGHELDELELPIPLGFFNVLQPEKKLKVVCI